MSYSPPLLRLISLAKFARKEIEHLSAIERGSKFLTGYCGIASRYLESIANKENIFPEFVGGSFLSYNRINNEYESISGHTWIEYKDYIVDITATQFKNVSFKVNRNFNKVYVCRATNPHYAKDWTGNIAKHYVGGWYEESLEDLCNKVNNISLARVRM